MNKIIIVGISGSGKTSLAKSLMHKHNIMCYDRDDYYWQPLWQRNSVQIFNEAISDITKTRSWIISGNFSHLQDNAWIECDTIIWLDYNIFLCIYRALCRSLKRIILKESCCNGNYETLRQLLFSRNSIILWIFKSFKKRRPFYNAIFNDGIDNKTYLRFINPQQTKNFLKNYS